MNRICLSACLLLIFSATLAQTSVTTFSAGPDSADYFFQKGLLAKEKAHRIEALKYFEMALEYDANSVPISKELAASYLDLRKYGKAREMFKKLESLGDQSASNYKQILTLSFQLKQRDDVLVYADKLKKADPAEKIAYYVGRVHYDNDNYGEAIIKLKEAAIEDPTNAEVPYLIAHSYADMMNYKLAIPFFQKAIELKPTEGYWVYELGLICYAMHDDKNALKYILEAGDKGYKRTNDYLENLGIAYLNVGNLDEGVKILNEILIRKPSDMNLLNMIAEACYYKGKFQLAMDYWDKILEYDKTDASALYMIGMCYQKKGGKENMAKGTRLCDTAIQMDPSLASYRQKKMVAGL